MDHATALQNFLGLAQAMLDAHAQSHGFPRKVLAVEHGRRYTKVVVSSETCPTSAYCFIDKNGDVLKPAGWSAPAKHARGNIHDSNPIAAIGPYGVAYLR